MLRRWLASDSLFMLAIFALAVGFVAGFGAVAFRNLIGLFHNVLFYGNFSFIYNANRHTAASPLGVLIILVPVAGAIMVAFLVKNFAPEAKGHGVPEVIDAMYYNRGIIRPVVALVKSVASSISIGSGGAVGREGPIIQIGAAFGSTLAQYTRLRQWQRMTLIASGAAGGIAATFNTPIGGLLFAIELIMPEISARTLIPVALATGTATFIGRYAFGDHPAFHIPALTVSSSHIIEPTTLAAYIVFGVLMGVMSVIYIRALYGAEDIFERIPGNYYTRHVLGMLMMGAMMYAFIRFTGHYYIQGVGYATVQDVLERVLSNPWLLLALCAGKLVATSLTLGSGASGGVFSPSLFMGATFGGAYALLITRYIPGVGLDVASVAIVGMAALVGSATGAVVTAIVMLFEMTRDYDVILPLMIVVSLAYGVRRYLLRGSIYDIKLARRGHFIPEALQTNMYLLHRAKEILRTPVLRVGPERNLEKLKHYMLRRRRVPHVIVVENSKVQAVLSADRVAGLDLSVGLERALKEHGSRRFIVVGADDMVFDIVARLRDSDCDIALVAPGGEFTQARQITGVLTWADVARSSNLPRNLLQRRTSVS